MSLEFNGAWDHGLIVDSGYYDEEYDVHQLQLP